MAEMMTLEQTTAVANVNRKHVDEVVATITSGVDTSIIRLDKYRGNKYLAVVFNADGSVAKKVDEDDGTQLIVKLTGDSGWQFTDALYGAMKDNGPDSKVMVWQWSEHDKRYIISRTVYKDGKALQPAGILDQLVSRKLIKVQKTSLPGVAELGFLADKASSVAKAAKDHEKTTKSGVYNFSPSEKSSVVNYFVAAIKGMGTEKKEGLSLLREFWPELWAKEESHK